MFIIIIYNEIVATIVVLYLFEKVILLIHGRLWKAGLHRNR